MAIDSRAYAWCNLGPLAEGQASSIAESHVPGTGLVTYRGTVNLAGIFRPDPGTVVQLAYSDGQNWIARLPLRLLVLSSHVNPLGRNKTTSVAVGCDLAYLEDRKQPPTSYQESDINNNVSEAIRRIVTPPIDAYRLVELILADLGLTAAGSIPLANKLSRDTFDMSAGFVAELGKLCQSEGYLCRMNPMGLVEFINKAPGIGTSVILSEEDLIDINPINSGDLPGDAVYSRYTTTSLKFPKEEEETDDERKRRNWEREESISPVQQYKHNWTRYVYVAVGEEQAKDEYGYELYYISDGSPVMRTLYDVKAFQQTDTINYINRSVTTTTYDEDFDVAIERVTVSSGLWGDQTSTTTYKYKYNHETDPRPRNKRGRGSGLPDRGNILVSQKTVEVSPNTTVYTAMGDQSSFYSLPRRYYTSSIQEVTYYQDEANGITKTVTKTWVPFFNTQDGSETLNRMRQNRQPWESVADLVAIATRLVYQGADVRISTQREYGLQKRPPQADRTRQETQTAPEVEQTELIVFSAGSALSQTAIELTPPYHSDPTISKVGNTWIINSNNASSMVRHYAVTENRLLLGHRNGNGIQVLPEVLPPSPMGLIYIRLNGCTAAFRTSGTTWTISSDGAVATTDALFWGAIDGTSVANAWFPLPPNTTSLPAPLAVTVNASPQPAYAMAIPSGFNPSNPDLAALFAALPSSGAPVFAKTVTPGVYLRPWHETITATAATGSGAVVTSQAWIVQAPITIVAGAGGGVTATYLRFKNLYAGGGTGVIATGMPFRNVFAGAGGGALFNDLGPVIGAYAGSGTGVAAERRLLLMAGSGTGAAVTIVQPADPDFSKVQLLIHGNGANDAQLFYDTSSAARAITVNGNTKTSTSQYVFNGSSIYFDGSSDRLSFPSILIGGSDDYCLDVWARPQNVTDVGIFGSYTDGDNWQAMTIQSGRLSCYIGGSASGAEELFAGGIGYITANTNYWFRINRVSGVLRLFINGTLMTTGSVANSNYFRISNLGWTRYRGDYQGWLAEARVTVTSGRSIASYALPTGPWADS